jgi:hypothetical protein
MTWVLFGWILYMYTRTWALALLLLLSLGKTRKYFVFRGNNLNKIYDLSTKQLFSKLPGYKNRFWQLLITNRRLPCQRNAAAQRVGRSVWGTAAEPAGPAAEPEESAQPGNVALSREWASN